MCPDLKHDEVDAGSEFARPPVVLALEKGSRVVYQGCAARVLAICSSTRIFLRIDGSVKTVWACAGELTGYHLTVGDFRSHPPKASTIDSNDELERAERWVRRFGSKGASGQLSVREQKKIAADMQVSGIAPHCAATLRTLPRRCKSRIPASVQPRSRKGGVQTVVLRGRNHFTRLRSVQPLPPQRWKFVV